MELIVTKEFVVIHQRNENIIQPGAVLFSNDGAYFGFREGLGLLLEAAAVARLRQAGCLANHQRHTESARLEAAE